MILLQRRRFVLGVLLLFIFITASLFVFQKVFLSPSASTLFIFGTTEPQAVVIITVDDTLTETAISEDTGNFSFSLLLPTGQRSLVIYAERGGARSNNIEMTTEVRAGTLNSVGELTLTIPGPCRKELDLNGDGKIDIADFSILMQHYQSAYCNADFNEDGIVDDLDVEFFLQGEEGG